MDAAPTGPPATTHQPNRPLTLETVLKEKDKGLSQREIASKYGVDRSAVRWLIEKHREEKQEVSEFKTYRADILANIQSKALTLQTKVMESLLKDGLPDSLTPHQKTGLLAVLVNVNGNAYDKERLETGQSTQNHSIVAKMLSSAVSDIYKPLKSKGTESTAPQSGAVDREQESGSTTYREEQQEHVPCQDSEAGGPGGQGEK